MRLGRVVLASGTVLGMLMGSAASPTGAAAATMGRGPDSAASRPRLLATSGHLPLHFEANQGQTDPRVKFLARGSGYMMFLTPTETVLVLRDGGTDRNSTQPGATVVRLSLGAAGPESAVDGLEALPGKVNYFIGNDPRWWRSNIPTYAKVRHRRVLPGVDVVYHGAERHLEQDFVLAPGTDPAAIRLSIRGAVQLAVDPTGDLVLHTGGGELRLRKPTIYQEVGGTRHLIAGGYARTGRRQIGFRVGAYDPSRPLVIDPVLEYSTYLGGGGFDSGNGIALDAAGSAYVVGNTSSVDFPTLGAAQPTLGGSRNVFVAKLDATGSTLVYATYLGGARFDSGNGIAVDTAGSAYVTGTTTSGNFPTTTPLQPTFGGKADAFVAKLDATGSTLVYSTYLGGSDFDFGTGIAVDPAGNAYVTGATKSTDFPTRNAFQGGLRGSSNAFVAKLSAAGATLLYSTYLGGSGGLFGNGDLGTGITVDPAGNAYVTGGTASADFPTTRGAVQPGFGGGAENAFVAKLDPAGAALVYATYLGGNGTDEGEGIAVDGAGNAYVTGVTFSTNFPTASAFQGALHGVSNAFVTKLDASGSMLVYSTYLGGTGSDAGFGVAVDGVGNTYVAGSTSSSSFPTVDALQSALKGPQNAFVAKLDTAGGTLLYSTFLGGRGSDTVLGIAVDRTGSAYVTGGTSSADFPVANAVQPTSHGGGDAFVAKITSDTIPPTTTATAAPGANANGWNNTDVTVALAAADNPGGSGVREIHFSLTGAQTGTGVQPGRTLAITITAEGTTVVTYFAVDNAGNQENPKTLMVKIDKTPPVVTFGIPTPAPNAAGWNNTDVSVPFTATDNLSGVASTSPAASPLSLTTEGSAVTGTVTVMDLAGNSATYTTPAAKIDKTPPTVACSASPTSLWPPNHTLVLVSATVTVTDSLSGPAGFTLTGATSSEPDQGLGDGDLPNDIQGFVVGTASTTGFLRAERSGTGPRRVYTLTYAGTDAAGNSTTCSATVTVPHDQGQ